MSWGRVHSKRGERPCAPHLPDMIESDLRRFALRPAVFDREGG